VHRFSFSRLRAAGLPLALAAGLALTAGACMSPAAKQSSAAEAAGERAARAPDRKTGSGEKGEKAGAKLSWWQRITQSHREPREKAWVYGDVRPGKGLLGDDEHGFTLLRKGEGGSPDPDKPTKVRR